MNSHSKVNLKLRKTIYSFMPILAFLLGSASVGFLNAANINEYNSIRPVPLIAHWSIDLMHFIQRDFEDVYALIPEMLRRTFAGGVLPLLFLGLYSLFACSKKAINRMALLQLATFSTFIYFIFWGVVGRNYLSVWSGWIFYFIMLG